MINKDNKQNEKNIKKKIETNKRSFHLIFIPQI
jgi:hypothetical protein